MQARALIGLSCLMGWAAWAGESVLPGTFEYPLGGVTVTTLVERQQTIGKMLLIGASDDVLKRFAPEGAVPNAINAFLVWISARTGVQHGRIRCGRFKGRTLGAGLLWLSPGGICYVLADIKAETLSIGR